jgi:hypothetical protein
VQYLRAEGTRSQREKAVFACGLQSKTHSENMLQTTKLRAVGHAQVHTPMIALRAVYT